MYADPARTFLVLALPWGGDGYLNLHWKRPDGTWAGQAFKDQDNMLRLMRWLERQPGVDVYACMSAQRDATERIGKTGRPYWRAERSLIGAVELKSLFLDIDVKKGAYPDTAAALTAFRGFLNATGLPRPMLMVASGGGGFHVHWLFNPPLPPRTSDGDVWLALAKALKDACKQHGLITDESVTADAARILRVPGTLNHKYSPPRDVLLGPDVLTNNYPVEFIAGKLAPYMIAATVPSPIITSSTATSGVSAPGGPNNDLTAGLEPQFVLATFDSAAAHVASLSPSPWELETGGEGLYADWRDFRFACVYVEIVHPHHAEAVRKLFAGVMAKVGRIPEKNWPAYERALASTSARIKAGQEVTTPGTVFKFAVSHGWSPPWASPGASRNAARIPLTEVQQDALALAKARVAMEYHAGARKSRDVARSRAAKFALHTIGDGVVRAALAPKIVVLMAADGWALGELIDVGTACGLSRDEARRLAVWALARIEQRKIA